MKKKKKATTAPTHGASANERPDVTPPSNVHTSKIVLMATDPVGDIHHQPGNIVEIAVGSITVKPEFRGRATRSKATVDEYAELMQNGTIFPPIVLFALDGEHILVDGDHRLSAAKKIGKKTITAELRHGTEEEALAYAVAANAEHGRPLTTKDKRHNAMLILNKYADRSDREVARLVGMSPTTVGSIRSELSNLDSSAGRRGKDGKTRRPKKSSGNESGEAEQKPLDAEAALERVSSFLHQELARWPKEARTKLGDLLWEFVNKYCYADNAE